MVIYCFNISVKKINHETSLFNKTTDTKKDLEVDKIKTTNVNILLNRVRLDRKRNLRKRIFLSILFTAVISFLTVYFII